MRLNDDQQPNLEETVKRLSEMPLLFDPGTSWNYSMSTDVCGRLVEVISGIFLDEYISQHITTPLGMIDTAFQVSDENIDRFTSNYAFTKENPVVYQALR